MKKAKRVLCLAIVFVMSFVLSSCTSVFDSGEALINAPSLFADQKKIMNALSWSVGEKITLVSARKGENRSAILLCDMDADGQKEAVAFYKTASATVSSDTVHINVLDKNNKGQWYSLCDTVGLAAAIDTVAVGTFSNTSEIVVGWEVIKDREKTLVCYSLSDKNLIREYSAPYIEFAVADFRAGDNSEIITLNYVPNTESTSIPLQEARLIVKDKGLFKVLSSAQLDSRVTGYKTCIAGKYDSENIGYFIDGQIDANNVTTQILTVSKNGELLNPLLNPDGKTSEDNRRKIGLAIQDFGSDGVLKVPYQEAVVGYENKSESEIIYKTVWKALDGNTFKRSALSYVNQSLSLEIVIPEKLDGKVTIKPSMAQNEIVFYEYEGSLEQSENALFSIRSVKKEQYQKQEGYDILISNEYITVTVKIFDGDNDLCPTLSTLYEMVNIL